MVHFQKKIALFHLTTFIKKILIFSGFKYNSHCLQYASSLERALCRPLLDSDIKSFTKVKQIFLFGVECVEIYWVTGFIKSVYLADSL